MKQHSFNSTMFSRHERRGLQGSSLQCTTAYCFWFFVMSHCLRQRDVFKIIPPWGLPPDAAALTQDDDASDSD